MIDKNLFTPLLKTLDKVILGIAELPETDNRLDFIEIDTEEEFDVERSMN